MVWPAGEAAFVTGAASGIGLGIARALVAAQAKVALADIDGPRLADVATELSEAGGAVTTVELDVSDADGWEAAADRAEGALGPISILCNNAGVNGGGAIDDTPFAVWRWVQRINVDAQFLGVSAFLPRFKRRGGRAHIMNTASMAGLVPMATVGAYVASKFASVGFTLVLREELRGTDVGVSLLCPGTVASRLSRTAEEGQAKLLGREPNAAVIEQNGALQAQGADPDRVGEQVVQAMQDRQFLIVTHRDWESLVIGLHREIEGTLADFDGRYGTDLSVQMMLGGVNPVAT
ncbi:SDR family NAD(P)-dependent oxidoreductase [Mycobacterium talmoniae]|uniref:Putative oxidoreductase EphD n=1 Tax=Mycobacterium talmoniae TaxID=1858794 RepID=A0A1S1NPK9_9MYCO|nr:MULTISPECIES: SDR family oxidoreductase [Mycobacterium]OHV06208.1 short-chain dehydrogenase [Mycobacterium talmoniae]PQM48715.1 putative oxidoreductase EphD [Mycobacterium talmoniae]TDH57092.1 SDR family oxidoreductase [Mycobacterium eburneum]